MIIEKSCSIIDEKVMKKDRINNIILFILALFMFGCVDDDFRQYGSDSLYVIGNLNEPETKTLYTEGEKSVSVSWEAGDIIGIYTKQQQGVYRYSAQSSAKQSLFLPEGEQMDNYPGDSVYAFYPIQEGKPFEYPKIALPQLLSQHYNNGEFNSDYDFLYSKSIIENGKVNMSFKHLYAFIKMTINTDLIKGIDSFMLYASDYIACYEDEESNGLYYDINTGKIVGGMAYNLWYNFPDEAIYSNKELTCYIAILPVPEGTELKFEVWENENSKIIYERKAPDGGFKAGHVYELNISENNYEEQAKKEKEALIALYKATDGDNWINNENWCSDRPLDEWYGVDYWSGHVRWFDLSNNGLKGSIPKELAALNSLDYINLCGNSLSGDIPEEITESEWWKKFGPETVIYQQEGCKINFPMYKSTDYSMHKKIDVIQRHTKGRGLKVVILGEAYTDRDIADGTYREHVDFAVESLFSEEPYTSFRDYFDIYCVNIVSENPYLTGKTAFETGYEFERNTFETRPDIAIDYTQDVYQLNNQLANVSTIILMKTNAPFRSNCWWYADGYSAAFCQVSNNMDGLKELIHHEVCGHGFGKLADEYVEFDGVYPNPEYIVEAHSRNESLNVDVTNDPNKIVWKYFLNDPRYAKEKIGIYEGADYYPKGVYRSTENSIMRYNTGGFNAPSRMSIFMRIKKLSGEVYRFEDFLEYDEINRQRINSQIETRSGYDEPKGLLGAPPRVMDYPSTEVKIHFKK